MNRSELIDLLAQRFPLLGRRDAEAAVDVLLDAMAQALARGQRIEIRGFGSFSISSRAAREGRNPRSGETVQIPERLVPRFKPGKALREDIACVAVGTSGQSDCTNSHPHSLASPVQSGRVCGESEQPASVSVESDLRAYDAR